MNALSASLAEKEIPIPELQDGQERAGQIHDKVRLPRKFAVKETSILKTQKG